MTNARMMDRAAIATATESEHAAIMKWIDGWYGESALDELLNEDPGQYAVLVSAMRQIPGYYPANDMYGGTMDFVIPGTYDDVCEYFDTMWREIAPEYAAIIADPAHWIVVPEGFIYMPDGYDPRIR